MLAVSTTGIAVSLKTELRFPTPGQQGHGSRIIQLLVKPVKAAIAYMPTASYELPYDGAKEMLLIDEVDDREYLTGLLETMYAELPTPKTKKKNCCF
jgi:hypothetical protein